LSQAEVEGLEGIIKLKNQTGELVRKINETKDLLSDE